MKIDDKRIVALAEWKYGGATPCLIVVQREDKWPGTGDFEDPSEIAEDRKVQCFSVWYENPSSKGTFNAGGGYFRSIEEAIEETTKKVKGPVIWDRRQ